MTEERTRLIYYGDNLDILRAHVAPQSVDLVYLDPPFKSQQQYNVLFRTVRGEPAQAQVRAFTDTWEWDQAARATYERLMNDPLVPGKVSDMIGAFHKLVKPSEMLAYLVMMTPSCFKGLKAYCIIVVWMFRTQYHIKEVSASWHQQS